MSAGKGARYLTPFLAAAVCGCGAPMEIFSSASEAAHGVTRLTWFMIILSAVVYVIVMAAMYLATIRHRAPPEGVDLSERSIVPILWAGVLLPALVLAAVFVVAESAMGSYPNPAYGLTVDVRAHQWWWDFHYDSGGAGSFHTANELHVPVNVPVRLRLTSADVIHSFWVPQLQGKMDVIPGETNELRLVARRAGVYQGACEEFCGAQHANMAITVIAEDSASFAQWMALQAMPAGSPADSTLLAGQHVFVTGPCVACHTIRGTPARGEIGPDLTHVGSRLTLAAGTLPNNLGSMAGWITNAQALKPGALMPTIPAFTGDQLRALASYVESLK